MSRVFVIADRNDGSGHYFPMSGIEGVTVGPANDSGTRLMRVLLRSGRYLDITVGDSDEDFDEIHNQLTADNA